MKCNPCNCIIEKKAYSTYLPTYILTELGEHLIPTPPQMYTEVRGKIQRNLNYCLILYLIFVLDPFKVP